ncbi:DNA-deoxyinosine glycosylase [Woeseia oceani]|uniref:DNA-deoxyinosine glycosylase n=1 Tax=Woeseia oceani TaxID=1548547 RepID=UPI0009F1AE93|nr:DNA-deoxyinosine glycosylase [Woeseia oceani]
MQRQSNDGDPTAVSVGFSAISATDARLLILGSLPGRPSLAAGEYYANPRNVFWRIMQELLQMPVDLPYAQRTDFLLGKRIALWDVLQSSRRAGSLDAAIEQDSARVNDFNAFLRSHTQLRLVALNGKAAGKLFRSKVLPGLRVVCPETVVLPSTSPAYAAMPYPEKRHYWLQVLDALAD